ncbi:MAG: hypothetical protein C7B45_00010 [Sulfobacillus acidophilus]|uniref:Uncharacterized protein n=1 Tax=Sulfobacillus acidophilus TaxID=53633 RepID=A0A2T2WP87_9FIRM|nr:MAG: hypothetical protein C7B45_00010 [Sulfobacillus acidophilus]
MVPIHDDGDDLQTVQGQDRDPIQSFARQDSGIVHDGPMRAKRRLHRFIPFVGFRHFANRPHRHLGRQAKGRPNVGIDQLLQVALVRRAFPKRDGGNGIAGGVEPLHRLQQRLRLVGRRWRMRDETTACVGVGSWRSQKGG